jgi:molybdenum cofactor cytidylyltransferase
VRGPAPAGAARSVGRTAVGVIAALLLAAGASRRFGSAKLVQDLRGTPLIGWSVRALRDPRVTDVVVVVPPDHDALRAAIGGTGVRFVVNYEADRGIARSIACGVAMAATRPDTRAVVVALGDEPFASLEVFARVLDRYEQGDALIVAPRFTGVIGHPVLFDRAVFPELAELDGDQGAHAVVLRDPARLRYVDFDHDPPRDVDTPDDLAFARRQAQNTSPSN